jgi:hypothetical protein
MDPHWIALGGMTLASLLLLVLAWMIGVMGMANLISNYRADPERYPDVEGLTRWMGFTLAAGGLSFGFCALLFATGSIGYALFGPWAGFTGVGLAVASFAGLARYRRAPGTKQR